ncbi:hypothetical protein Rrhod_1123 [Rhodococcus rhodnii LMG 5362]|uniref:DUF2510 domain-containing protein n=2 Tax=Rhodococcus rhodnii TaxID=38312 RepID=R7WQ46_9NOCA|nr:hypothetical protein Rrhod_1123 [Rhodococcus rhodnii LMG 5362]
MDGSYPAGWYRDPRSTEHARWWNGTSWSSRSVALDGEPSTFDGPVRLDEPTPPARPMRLRESTTATWTVGRPFVPYAQMALAACGALLVGHFGPWAELLGDRLVRIDTYGDGWAALALIAAAVTALGVTLAADRVSTWIRWIPATLGAVASVVAIVDARTVTGHAVERLGITVSASLGWGLLLTLVGALTLTATGVAVGRLANRT